MDFYSSIEKAIDDLKKNKYGIIIKKTKKNMVITTSIKFPEEILNKEISQISIEFLLIIDLYKPKFFPKLYCISPYCYPHFADGRDLFRELPSSKNQKKIFNFSNILSEILEFIKANFQKGGLYFFGKYYLGSRYDLRMFQKACNNKNIFNVKENLVLNGKSIKLNRILIISDVYFLMFEQEKWYKNNLILNFWSSISNIQKIQKVKDNKTLILQWAQKENENYIMSLTVNQREDFINVILDKMHQFGMKYNIQKLEENRELGDNLIKKKSKDMESQNQKLLKNNDEEENEDYNEEEEEEEDDDNNEEGNKEENKEDNKEEDKKEKKIENNEDINIVNNKKEKEEEVNGEENDEDEDEFKQVEEEKNNSKEENGGINPVIKQDNNKEEIIKQGNEEKKEEEKVEEKNEQKSSELKEEKKEDNEMEKPQIEEKIEEVKEKEIEQKEENSAQ